MGKTFDIILMGATSFVGKITARRFAQWLAAHPDTARIALAARSKSKLTVLLQRLKDDFPSVTFETVVADSMIEAEMTALAQSTRVVISTVGPYDLFGEPLVKACCEQGTHYCDLTGEPQFIFNMLNKYESLAKDTGACIVNCCGFDSIPSDLGTLYLQQQAQETFGAPCEQVDMRLKAMSGGFSGGTIASLVNVVKNARKNASLRKVLFDPYALSPSTQKTKQRFIGKAQPDWATDQWVAPFLMAGINSKIVMRSAALMSPSYPVNFKYCEGMLGGRASKGRRRAKMISAALNLITLSSAFAPSRWVLENWVMPKPGEGPSETEQENGFFVAQFYGQTAKGEKLAVQVKGDQDPGYGSTSKMLSQAGLAIAFDIPEDTPGGFWTPASLLGQSLLHRLPLNAGFEFKVL